METKVLTARDSHAIRLVHLSDPHLSATSPPSWKIDYFEHTEKTLEQVFTFVRKQQVDAIVFSGDLFHKKSPTSNPLRFMSKVAEWLRCLADTNVYVCGVGGNHDLKWGSLEGLSGQPLELLVQAGLFHLLDREELLIQADGFDVRVAGCSYEHGSAEGTRGKLKQGAKYLVSVGHFWFGCESGELFGEKVYGPDYLGLGEPDVYFIGHHHDDQGVQFVNNKWYLAHGSINRTGGREQDLVRRPAAGSIEFTGQGIDVKVLRPKVSPADEVIDFAVRSQILEEKKEMEQFLSTIRSTKMEFEDPKQILGEMDLDLEVRERAQQYLDQAEESVK